jgi:hypothetical protein
LAVHGQGDQDHGKPRAAKPQPSPNRNGLPCPSFNTESTEITENHRGKAMRRIESVHAAGSIVSIIGRRLDLIE